MDLELIAAFPAVKKVVDIIRYLFDGQTRQWREVAVVVGSWVAGTGVVALVAASSFGADLGLDTATVADFVLYGIGLGSAAGVAADFASPSGVTIV